MLKKITLITASTISAFAMHMAEININDKDLEVAGRFDIGQFNDNVEPNTMFFGAKFFNPVVAHASSSIRSIKPYYEANFLIMREVGNYGLALGMGIKLNYTRMNSINYSALPLGAEVAYTFPAPKVIPITLGASIYYAPEVLSFADATAYLDYKVHLDIELIKNAGVTMGYRNMNMSAGNNGLGSTNYNSSGYLGFQFKF